MNATLFDGGKVHRLAGLAARCGVGKGRPRCAWQMDLSGVTCRRCINLFGVSPKRTRETRAAPPAIGPFSDCYHD